MTALDVGIPVIGEPLMEVAATMADIPLLGLDDAQQLVDVDDPDAICDRYANMAAELLVLGHGAVAPMPRRAEVEGRLTVVGDG